MALLTSRFKLHGMSNVRPDPFVIAMVTFCVGLLAVVIVFALHASGYENLPLWLNLPTVLAPAGLITGVVTSVVRTRRQTRQETR